MAHEDAVDVLTAATNAAGVTTSECARAIDGVTEAFRAMARQLYRERGAPYGDTEKGLSEWIARHPCWLDKIAAGEL